MAPQSSYISGGVRHASSAARRSAISAFEYLVIHQFYCAAYAPDTRKLREIAVEKLKPLDEVLKPDERLRYFGYTLEYVHASASAINLNPAAPENVHDQFTIAKNAYLYSWYVYSFLPVALLYSILAIELALNFRVKQANPAMFASNREPALFRLLSYALQQRWIVDNGFDIQVPDDAMVPDKIAKQFPNIPRDQRYSFTLLDVLVGLRNDLAHGTYMLVPGIGPLLQRGAEIINQLFPEAESK